MSSRYGVIDIGTLKVKLQIAEKSSTGELIVKEQSNVLTCLGCHMAENGNRPLPENLEKLMVELNRCQKMFQKYQVLKTRIVSTHALREMGTVGQEIASAIKIKTGLEVEIISPEAEANLFYQAVLGDMQTDDDYTVIDMGGGSAQILIGNRLELKNYYLLKTGTSTLWDMFMIGNTGQDHPTEKQLQNLHDYVVEQQAHLPEKLGTPLIWGSSCVIDLFRGLHLPMEINTGSPSHPYRVQLSELEKLFTLVKNIPLDTREEMFVSPTPKYMWGLDMALTNVIELAKHVGSDYVIPSNANINLGLLKSLLS